MGFLDKLFSGNSELIEWQNAVMASKSQKLYATRKQLEAATVQMVADNMRIFDDSANIINSTTKPDVFFSRLELAEEKLANLVNIEPYIKQVKSITMNQPLSSLMNEFQKNKNRYIVDFLYRYYWTVKEKAEGMKTEKGKLNQFQKFRESLEPFIDQLNDTNKKIFESMCQQKI